MSTKRIVLVVAIGGVMLSGRSAYAYIDPGTGSYVLQAVIGVLMGGLLFLKMFWAKIKGIFSGKDKDDRHETIRE